MPPVKAVEEEERYTTPPTVWVGVLPNTLSGAIANDFATAILGIVNQYGVTGVEVAFRESKAPVKTLHKAHTLLLRTTSVPMDTTSLLF